ncbi:NAD-dependent epimerase/dehydratase family protein [Luedemannella flava]|uniref:NAD-dependent epimerase/dehydratase family protein n=1 Tax=Luedemannella flava TaxID=349316 RepID=A0ABP4YVG5_9ACTN
MKVLVTGVGRFLGAHLAARLAVDPRVTKVIGVDTRPPAGDLARLLRGKVTVVTDDLRGVVASVTESGVEAVAHLGVLVGAGRGGRAAQKEYNIIGTMQLLAAVQAAPAVRKLVVRSSTAAYGASFRDPAVFTEATPPTEMPRGGFAKDVIEIEGYVRGFRRRRPDVATTVLRLAPLIGPEADTILTRYFALPVVPTVLGRDPRLQFLHVDDVLEILVRSVVEDHQGTFNVAGAGVLTLSQAIRRAGRMSVPVVEPGMSAFATLARSLGLGEFSMDQLDLFVHGRVVDTSRLVAEYGYTPRSTPEAFADMIAGRRLHESGTLSPLRPGVVSSAEQALLGGIRAARRAAAAAVSRGDADV